MHVIQINLPLESLLSIKKRIKIRWVVLIRADIGTDSRISVFLYYLIYQQKVIAFQTQLNYYKISLTQLFY
jgi:hypothetical protein